MVPPVQVVEALAGVATTTPVGRLSLKPRAVAFIALVELSMVNLRVLVSPWPIPFGAKTFAKVGFGSI